MTRASPHMRFPRVLRPSHSWLLVPQELNQTDKARRALSLDAACLRQLSARLTNAVAGSKAPGKIPLVVEMLRVLVQLPASAAGAARESGLLKVGANLSSTLLPPPPLRILLPLQKAAR